LTASALPVSTGPGVISIAPLPFEINFLIRFSRFLSGDDGSPHPRQAISRNQEVTA
jgi:hypothetical protein